MATIDSMNKDTTRLSDGPDWTFDLLDIYLAFLAHPGIAGIHGDCPDIFLVIGEMELQAVSIASYIGKGVRAHPDGLGVDNLSVLHADGNYPHMVGLVGTEANRIVVVDLPPHGAGTVYFFAVGVCGHILAAFRDDLVNQLADLRFFLAVDALFLIYGYLDVDEDKGYGKKARPISSACGLTPI